MISSSYRGVDQLAQLISSRILQLLAVVDRSVVPGKFFHGELWGQVEEKPFVGSGSVPVKSLYWIWAGLGRPAPLDG